MIVIVDYGMSNLQSIKFKLGRNGIKSIITSNPDKIAKSDKLILAGVGHFGKAMENLNEMNLLDILNEKIVVEKCPIFGICLGMQLFSNYSEEGNSKGLGWIDGTVKRFSFKSDSNLKIPHVGWNSIKLLHKDRLIPEIRAIQYFYFTHSYHMVCDDDIIVAQTDYGFMFPSIIRKGNIFGTQFHPEKSHLSGFQMLKEFCEDFA